MTYRYDALNKLQQELDRTAVISKDFKSWIMQWAQAAAMDAYTAGQRNARPAAYWRIVPKPGSNMPDCFRREFETKDKAEKATEGLLHYIVVGFDAAGKIVEP